MKKIDQTIFVPPNSNCFQACVASIFELPMDYVPNFCAAPGNWWSGFERFCSSWGYWPLLMDVKNCRDAGWEPQGYHIIDGDGPRGLCHAVVGWCGGMIHDPHPSRIGLVTEENWTVFVARFELRCIECNSVRVMADGGRGFCMSCGYSWDDRPRYYEE